MMASLTALRTCNRLLLSSTNRLSAAFSSDVKPAAGNVPVLLETSTALLSPEEQQHAKKLREGLIPVTTPMDITLISGVPEEHIKGRRVKIFASPKNAMQSGTFNMGQWTMEFETRERWENPLMGWSSSGDPLSNVQVQFASQADAIEFCNKNGWEWYIEQKKEINARAKAYAANFSWNKKSRVSTK